MVGGLWCVRRAVLSGFHECPTGEAVEAAIIEVLTQFRTITFSLLTEANVGSKIVEHR